jgi:predicted nucleic acid-binding protein
VKIFWDTNLFIYLWEKKTFVQELALLTAFMEEGEHQLATSTLSLGEILVHPFRSGRADLVTQYREGLDRLVLIPYEREASVHFARLRAHIPSLRPPDAIQLACAVSAKCDLFLTNDIRLSNLSLPTGKLRIQSLGEWAQSSLNQ